MPSTLHRSQPHFDSSVRSLAAALSATLALTAAGGASAQGALSTAARVPIEQRVALAVGPDRTTLWTQLRVRTAPGALAIVLPAAPGASLDWSTPAWLEALELSTAPRVLPPASDTGTCPGDPPEEVVDMVGHAFHENALNPLEVAVLSDADAVVTWAEQRGMSVPTALHDAMISLGGSRFVAVRFEAPDGETMTPALRVVGPGPSAILPLVLTEATSEPLLVTAWTLGEGRATLDGPAESITGAELTFDAGSGESDYAAARRAALLSGAGSSLLECSSRAALVGGLDFGATPQHIDGAVTAYFKRAALYQSGAIDAPACISAATAALQSPALIASSCPRAELGIVDGGTGCTEAPGPGEIDPAALRCGALADDLAIALAGLPANGAWLSRHALMIDSGALGVSHAVATAPGAAFDPVWTAGAVDSSGCDGAGGGSSSASSSSSGSVSSSGSGSPTEVEVPVYEVDTSCGAHEVGDILYYIVVEAADPETAPDYYYEEHDSCSGDTSGSTTPVYSESSAAVDGYGYGSDGSDGYQGNDCSGDSSTSSSSSDCSGDSSTSSSSSDCSGDSSGSSSSSDCSGDSSGSSSSSDCGGDSSGSSSSDCSFSRPRPRHLPRLSILITALAALLAPIRRLRRPRRRRRHQHSPRRRRAGG